MHRVKYRNDHVAQLIKDFNADGAIYEQMKFCTYWSYERVIASQVMPRDYGIHMLSIDRPYISGQSGQLARECRHRERLEIKKIRTAQKEENDMAYNPKTGKGLGRYYDAEHRAFRAPRMERL